VHPPAQQVAAQVAAQRRHQLDEPRIANVLHR
jgi:hypothetical protein